MRDNILSYLTANRNDLKPLIISDNLPWIDNNGPLYHHNKKHIYVDTPQTTQNDLVDAFNQAGYVDEVTTVSVYFVIDAKQPLTNYDSIVDVIKGARLNSGTQGYVQRLVQVSSDYNADALTTTLEFSFRRLITN